MAVRVLGPLDIGIGHISPRERAVLAALVVRRGSSIAPAELAEAYWGERTPQTWEQQVRTAIARIRRALGGESVARVAAQYALRIDPDSIDAVRFERLVSSAREHALHGEPARAIEEYRRALALWRGAPYPELADWGPGIFEAARLQLVQEGAEEELLEARLADGDHRAVIADAERLVSERPLRESRWAILALANYRDDRQADALAVLREAHRRLRDELGIEPGERLAHLATAILRHDPSLAAPKTASAPAAGTAPYRGLRPYGVADRDEFFGREGDIDAVADRVEPGRAVVIAGPSGSGKSSLLLAGVLPRLAAAGRTSTVLRPGANGLADITKALADPDPVHVVAIDQAEELLAGVGDAADFAALGRAAVDFMAGGGALLLTLRSDFLDAAARLPQLGRVLSRGVVLLGPLAPASLREAIEQPALHTGLRLEPGLVELLLRDAEGHGEVLPHLSHALVETWERREGRTLTVAGYTSTGGVAGAIARSAEDLYRALDPDGQLACRALLLRLIDRTPEGSPLRRRVSAAALRDDPPSRDVVERLVAARLVAADGDSVIVAHEALATAWPRLAGWLDEDAEEVRVQRSIELAAAAWEAAGRTDDDLLRGARLDRAVLSRATAPFLTASEEAFLDASADRELAAKRALDARAVRDRRQNRVLRWALVGTALALVGVLVAGGFAVGQARRATEASVDARIEALTSTSLALRSSDADVAALLAVEAYHRWPQDARARSALLGVMVAAGGLIQTSVIPSADESAAMLIEGTRRVLAVRDRRAAAGWATDLVEIDLDTGDVARTFPGVTLPAHEDQVNRNIHVSSDGRVALVQSWLGGACCTSRLDFVDLRSGVPLGGSQTVDFRGGLEVGLGETGETAYLVDLLTGTLIAIDPMTGALRRSAAPGPAVVENPDLDEPGVTQAVAVVGPGLVAVGAIDGMTIFDGTTLEALRDIALPPRAAEYNLIPDGLGGVIAAGGEGLVRVDIATGSIDWQRAAERPNGYGIAAVNTSAGTLLAADFNGHVDEFRLDSGEPTGRAFTSRQGQFGVPKVVDGGRELVFIDAFSPLIVRWRLDGRGPASTIVARGHNAIAGFGDGGSLIAVQDSERTGPSMVWDVGADRPTGLTAPWFGWAGPDTLVLWPEAGAAELVDAGTGRAHVVADEAIREAGDQDWWLAEVDGGEIALVVGRDRMVPITPATGTIAGPAMQIPPGVRDVPFVSISAADDRLVVTWQADAASVGGSTSVYDLATGELIATGLRDDTLTVAAGKEVISAGPRRLVRADIDSLEPFGSLPRPVTGPQIMQARGGLLMVATYDQRVWLYDLSSGIRLGDAIPAGAAAFVPGFMGPDGATMLVNVPDGVQIWDLDPAAHAEAACRIAGRNLTAEEWVTYLGDLGPYRSTCR